MIIVCVLFCVVLGFSLCGLVLGFGGRFWVLLTLLCGFVVWVFVRGCLGMFVDCGHCCGLCLCLFGVWCLLCGCG